MEWVYNGFSIFNLLNNHLFIDSSLVVYYCMVLVGWRF